jgi:hypothetical protein
MGILLVAMNANNEKRKTPKQLEREKVYGGEDPWAVGRGSNRGDGVYDDYFK